MPETMLHIASAVVKARPSAQQSVVEGINALPGANVIAVDHGRIVVILEADHQRVIADVLDRIAGLDSVLSATLVYEHAEPEEETHESP